MNPIIYALNSSDADCFFIEFKDEKKFVLIDGGNTEDVSFYTPLKFVREKNIDKIDILILTHIHKDHLGGFADLIKYVSISEAVLPYPVLKKIVYSGSDNVDIKNLKYAINEYANIYERLREKGVKISIAPPFENKSVWNIGDFRLVHKYPTKYDFMPGYEIINGVDYNNMSSYDIDNILINFNLYSNFDCSLWCIEKDENIAIFGGDVPLLNWRKILYRHNLSSKFLKVSHHGKKDSIDRNLVKSLKVKHMIISNRCENLNEYKKFWNEISSNGVVKYAVTGEKNELKYIIYDFERFSYIME